MKARVKTAMGIDISPHWVRAAWVQERAGEFRVVDAATAPVLEGVFRSGDVADVKGLARVIRQLGSRNRIHATRAAVALPTGPLVMQTLDLPTPMPGNLGDFVERELRQYVALSGRDAVSDFCGVGTAAGSKSRLLALATDAGSVRKVVKACSVAGVRTDAIEPPLLAYVRAIDARSAAGGPNRYVLVAELGTHNLSVCLFREGAMDLVRVKPLPAPGDKPGPFCSWLAGEFRAVMCYCGAEASHGSCAWETQLVVRDAARLPAGDIEVLKAEAGMATLAVVDGRGVPLEGSLEQGDGRGDSPSKVAVGLAMKLLDPDEHDWNVNLLPDDITRTRSLVRHVRVTAIAGAFLFLVMLLVLQGLMRTTDRMHEHIERARQSQQLDTTAALVAKAGGITREVARVKQQVDELNKILQERHDIYWPAVLDAIADATPADVCITEFACEDNRKLSLKGRAASYDAAQAFVQELGDVEPLESAFVAKAKKQEDARGLIQYQIDCLLAPRR